MDLRYYIHTIDQDGGTLRGAQGDVKYGALLGDIDLVSAKHSVDVLTQIATPRPTGSGA